jgi:hypothetical protein
MSPGRVELVHDNLHLAHDFSRMVPGAVLAGKASVRSADRDQHLHTLYHEQQASPKRCAQCGLLDIGRHVCSKPADTPRARPAPRLTI